MTAATHVVFGTGPAGRAVATALARQGDTSRVVNRSGRRRSTGRDRRRRRHRPRLHPRRHDRRCEHRLLLPQRAHYHRWAEEFPPLQRAVLGAARAAGAELVVLENLYMYGPTTGPHR